MLLAYLAAFISLAQAVGPSCTPPEPSHVMSDEPNDNIEAAVYSPCEDQSIDQLVEELSKEITRAAPDDFPFLEEKTDEIRNVSVATSTLFGEGGGKRAILLRRSNVTVGTRPRVCLIFKPDGGHSDALRAIHWCLSFVVGPTKSVEVLPLEKRAI